MIRIQEVPLIGLMIFTLVYATIGNPSSPVWSGLYFLVNYVTLLVLFYGHKSKIIRVIGIALSIAMLIFTALKYFWNLEVERYYTLVPFLICVIGIIVIEYKNGRLDRRKIF